MNRWLRAGWTCILFSLPVAAAAQAGAQAAPAAPPAPPAPCAGAAHAALDFWVGEWDVFAAGTDRHVATSRIERLHGCVIREQWMPLSGAGGSSLSHYDPARRAWRQLWLDGNGSRVEFEGGPVGDTVVLTGLWPNVGGPGRDALIRMTYSRLGDGAVRQHGEMSVDWGLSWQPSFSFDYRPRRANDGQPGGSNL